MKQIAAGKRALGSGAGALDMEQFRTGWEKDQLAAMEKAVADIQTAKYGKPLDPNEPNFGGGWQGDAMRRQYELDQAMGRSWN